MELTPEQLALIAGSLLSLLFAYVPGFKTWFGTLDSVLKADVMALLLVVVCVAIFCGSCWGAFDFVQCSTQGIVKLVLILVAALTTNQTTYMLLVRPRQNSHK